MIGQLDRHCSDIVIEEGSAYAEAMRGYVRSSNHGNALRSWLDGLVDAVEAGLKDSGSC